MLVLLIAALKICSEKNTIESVAGTLLTYNLITLPNIFSKKKFRSHFRENRLKMFCDAQQILAIKGVGGFGESVKKETSVTKIFFR